MNILIAPNSMKGSLDGRAFAEAIAGGFRRASPVFNLRLVPIADGGDHTGELLREVMGAREYREVVADPLGRPVEACYGIAGQTAVIAMSEASGLRLLKEEELCPGEASSYGTGQLIGAALDRGCREILLGLGGSATIDGGIGLLSALGFAFYDQKGVLLPALPASLRRVAHIRTPEGRLSGVSFVLLADVPNFLLGGEGAAATFGPQKGAGPVMVRELEAGLAHWVSLLEALSGLPLRDLPGMGAAGGVASGLVALCGARLMRGADFLFDLLKIDQHLAWADWVITGEGCCDTRGNAGKAPGRLAARAALARKPVTALTGSFDTTATLDYAGVFSLCNGPDTLRDLMTHAARHAGETAFQLARLLLHSFPEAAQHHSLLTQAGQAFEHHNPDAALSLLRQEPLDQLAATWFLRGSVFQKLQKWGDAINCYARCLELDPRHQKAETGLAMVRQILSFRNPDLLNP